MAAPSTTTTPQLSEPSTEWGVMYGRGRITACESELAARQLQADSGGELACRRTYVTSWPGQPATGEQHRGPAAIRQSA